MLNKTINGYTIKRPIGKGGMAEVWYAENSIGNPAAVKCLKRKFCEDETVVTRFQNEAMVMVKLKHPNIRQVYDYVTFEGSPAIIMEYLEGEDLKTQVKEHGAFDGDIAANYWNQIVAALDYTHGKGVVHRDIKPSNIFVTKDGQIKLLDFGIAKVRDAVTGTQTGQKLGTLVYMSPEQITDSKHVDNRTDIYSLAVTFVHLLTGRIPYDTDTSSDFEIMEQIVHKPLVMTSVPNEWQGFLHPYLMKNPDKRPKLQPFTNGSKRFPNNSSNDTIDDTDPLFGETKHNFSRNSNKRELSFYFLGGIMLLVAIFAILFVKKGNILSSMSENGDNNSIDTVSIEKTVTFYNNYNELEIGDYVYEDGSFSHERSSEKSIIGVVFSLEPTGIERNNGWTHGLIMALEDCGNGQYYKWSSSESALPYPHMIVDLTHTDLGLRDKQGYLYTYKGATNSASFQAFSAARNYKPKLKNGSGWYLPTLGQWADILKNLGGVDISTLHGIDFDSETAYSNLKKYGLSNDYYWTATESYESHTWVIYLGQGDVDGYTGKTHKCKVRAVCAF